MEIIPNPSQPATAPTPRANTKISSDFDTFLKMLTAQIQNQDPLNPIDSADYAVQLATFSSVEQQTLTNQKLDNLTGQFDMLGMAQLAAWVGKEARTAGPVWFEGTPLTLSPNPVAGADRTVLVVSDAAGNVVSRDDIPVSAAPFEWQGTDITGNLLPEGRYTLSLESSRSGLVIGTNPMESYATVQEVQGGPGGNRLILTGGIEVPASGVTALRNGG